MFTDPMSLTYDSVAHSLPRASSPFDHGELRVKKVNGASYVKTDAGLTVITRQFSMGVPHLRRHEISLVKYAADNDTNPFNNGIGVGQINGVGLVYYSNDLRVETVSEIPKLQTALLALVTNPVRDRLLGGEV